MADPWDLRPHPHLNAPKLLAAIFLTSYRSDCSDDGRDSYMATEYDRLPPRATPDHPSLPTREYIAENEQATYQNGESSGSEEEECSGEIQECQK